MCFEYALRRNVPAWQKYITTIRLCSHLRRSDPCDFVTKLAKWKTNFRAPCLNCIRYWDPCCNKTSTSKALPQEYTCKVINYVIHYRLRWKCALRYKVVVVIYLLTCLKSCHSSEEGTCRARTTRTSQKQIMIPSQSDSSWLLDWLPKVIKVRQQHAYDGILFELLDVVLRWTVVAPTVSTTGHADY